MDPGSLRIGDVRDPRNVFVAMKNFRHPLANKATDPDRSVNRTAPYDLDENVLKAKAEYNNPGESIRDSSSSIGVQLAEIFRDATRYRKLLAFRGVEAQILLDTFQILLDHNINDASFRGNLAVALQRLCLNTGFYPQGFELLDIEIDDDQPVAGGGFADIYQGKFQGEVVCLKLVRIYEPYQVDHLIKEYSREAILWRQLSHPNLLPFFGICRLRSRMSFVSPWAENGHILKFLKLNTKADRMLLCLDAAAGVKYLHENGIIHGDLKALNVLVDTSGRAVLADFGFSAVSDPQILHWTSHSSAASKGGTIRWQAPELQEDGGDLIVHNTRASDIYALACVYYEIFTEKLPFFESNRDATVITKVSNGKRPSMPARSQRAWTEWGLTDAMWELMNQCWAHDPQERPVIARIVEQLSPREPFDVRPPGSWAGNNNRSHPAHPQPPSLRAVENLLAGIPS